MFLMIKCLKVMKLTWKNILKNKKDSVLALLRIVMGWTMLWAFLDKLFGLGFATKPQNAWLAGGSPTEGFLNNAVQGPFAEIFSSLSGSIIVDWLFMLGLLGVGIGFLLGIAMRFSGYVGALMMTLMYLSLIQPTSNPITDQHIIYALVFLWLGGSDVGQIFGLQNWWRKTLIAKRVPILA